MRFFDRIGSILQKQSNNKPIGDEEVITALYYYKMVDEDTNVVMNFKIEVDNEHNTHIAIVDSIPENVEPLKYQDATRFIDDICKVREKYLRSLEPDRIFLNPSLYDITFADWQIKYPDDYHDYLEILNKVQEKCQKYGINISRDSNDITRLIIDNINARKREEYKSLFGNNKFIEPDQIPRSDEITNILQELMQPSAKNKFDAGAFARHRLVFNSYISSFMIEYPYFYNLLNKEQLNQEDLLVLKTYCEFLIAMSKIFDISRDLDKCETEISIKNANTEFDALNNNKSFLNDIESLLAKCDFDSEELYIHATADLATSKSIMDRGLYTFGEPDSFCFPYSSVEQILRYGYGSSTNFYNNYIVIFRVPKGATFPSELSKQEAKEALNFVNMRRMVVMEPNGIINSSDILGVIDKKNMKVIENPKYCLGNSRSV